MMWVVSEAQKHGIHTETSLRIGMVPLGTGQKWGGDMAIGNCMELRFSGPLYLSTSTLTGNDFAQALGWGGRTDMAHIRKAEMHSLKFFQVVLASLVKCHQES